MQKKKSSRAPKLEVVRFMCSTDERDSIFLAAGEKDQTASDYIRGLHLLDRQAKREGKALVIEEPGRAAKLQEQLLNVLDTAQQAVNELKDSVRSERELREKNEGLRAENAKTVLDYQTLVFELRSEITQLTSLAKGKG